MDIVTVFHSDRVHADTLRLFESLSEHEPTAVLLPWDNREVNLGFGPACNRASAGGSGRVIGFLNPDAIVSGTFSHLVDAAFADPNVMVTGCRFGKCQRELDIWGVREWVCGAAMFVRREWFEALGGFDERFVWGWDDTDLVRQTEACGMTVRPIDLPIHHESPQQNTAEEAAYKNHHFDKGGRLYYEKWRRG